MKQIAKCELCELEISSDKCAFAVHKKVINGEEHCFCCEHHAEEFEHKRKRSETKE